MRTIKFRAWDKVHNLMGFCHSIEGMREGHYMEIIITIENDFKILLHDEEFELMQFTGLQDSKKNDIYEGDILLSSGIGEVSGKITNKITMKSRTKPHYVLFNDGDFKIKPKTKRSKKKTLNGGRILRNQLEIIGNIHENPELL